MKRKALLAVALLAILAAAACAERSVMVGGPCDYEDTPGKALVTAVGAPDPDEANCINQPRVVLFDFVPDKPVKSWRFPNWGLKGQRLQVAGGFNPSAKWLRGQGIKVGTELTCIRREIVKGTCTPVVWDFPELAMSAAAADCQGKD